MISRQALHCGELQFVHPFTGEDIHIKQADTRRYAHVVKYQKRGDRKWKYLKDLLKRVSKRLKNLLNENRMTRFRTEYLALHNYEQSMIFANLEKEDREKIYQYLSPSELADVFDMLESQDETIDIYFEEMSPPYAASVLGEMYADNAVDVLNSLKNRERINLYMNLNPCRKCS